MVMRRGAAGGKGSGAGPVLDPVVGKWPSGAAKITKKTQIRDGLFEVSEKIAKNYPVPKVDVVLNKVPDTKAEAVFTGVGVEVTIQLVEVPGSSGKDWNKDGYDKFIHPSVTSDPETSGFVVEIYNDNGGSPGTVIAEDHEAGIFFDYQSGHLTIEDPTQLPTLTPPYHIKATRYVGRKLSDAALEGTPEQEKFGGREHRTYTTADFPELDDDYFVGAEYVNGQVWFLRFGYGMPARLYGFDAITKKPHFNSPIDITEGTDAHFCRNLTNDGENLWVVGHEVSGAGSPNPKSYLWKITPDTGEQKFFDLTDEPENACIRAFVVWWFDAGGVPAVNGLDIDVDINSGGPVTFTFPSQPTNAADAVDMINTWAVSGGYDIEARAFIDPIHGVPQIMILTTNDRVHIDVSGTAIDVTWLHDSLHNYRGTGFRELDFEGRNRNLWITDNEGPSTNFRQRGLPFVWNVDSESAVGFIEDLYVNDADVPCKGICSAGPVVVGGYNLGRNLFIWDADTLSAIGTISTGVSLDLYHFHLEYDGRFVYGGLFKFDPETRSITHINLDNPYGINGSMNIVTEDSVMLFERMGNRLRFLSKEDLSEIGLTTYDHNFIHPFGSFHGTLAYDGHDVWYCSHHKGVTPPEFAQKSSVRIPKKAELIKKGNISKAIDRFYEGGVNKEDLKQIYNNFIGKLRLMWNDDVPGVVGSAGLVLGDMCYFSVVRASHLDPTDARVQDAFIAPLPLLDARTSRYDDMSGSSITWAGVNQNGNLFYQATSPANASDRKTLPLLYSEPGQLNSLNRPLKNITDIRIDSLGNLWITDNGLGFSDTAGNIVVINLNSGKVVFEDFHSALGGPALSPGCHCDKTIIFDNLGSQAWDTSLKTLGFVVCSGVDTVYGIQIDQAVNAVDSSGDPTYGYIYTVGNSFIGGEEYGLWIPFDTIHDADKWNEFLIVVDNNAVHLIDIMREYDESGDRGERRLSIPTLGANLVHSTQSSIFVGFGDRIEEWKFSSNRTVFDKFASTAFATRTITLSQPLSDDVSVGDIAYLSSQWSSPNFGTYLIEEIVSKTPVGVIKVSDPWGTMVSDFGSEFVEIYPLTREFFAKDFSNVTLIKSHKDSLYVVDNGSKPYDETDPPVLYKFNISDSIEDSNWRDTLDLSWDVEVLGDKNSEQLNAHAAGETVTLSSSEPPGTALLVRVYGLDGSNVPVTEDLLYWAGNPPTVGSQVFNFVVGNEIIGLLPSEVPFPGVYSLTSTTSGNLIFEPGASSGLSLSQGIWSPSAYPNTYLPKIKTSECYGAPTFFTYGNEAGSIVIFGEDLGGSPVSEILAIDGNFTRATNTYSKIFAITLVNSSLSGAVIIMRLQRPTRISHMVVDGNHLVALDSSNNHLLKKEL